MPHGGGATIDTKPLAEAVRESGRLNKWAAGSSGLAATLLAIFGIAADDQRLSASRVTTVRRNLDQPPEVTVYCTHCGHGAVLDLKALLKAGYGDA